MWVFTSSARQHLLVWGRRVHRPVSVPSGDSQLAPYHVTASLLHPKDGSFNPVVRKRPRQKPDVSYGWRDRHRSAQSEAWKNESPAMQTTSHRKGDDQRVSSELRKLFLEDSPGVMERPVACKPTRDSKLQSLEIVFGISPCLLALTQGRRKVKTLFVKDNEAPDRASVIKVCEEACRRGVQVQRVSKNILERMSSGRVHQGVCLEASPLRYLTERTDSAPSTKEPPPLWLVLEAIQDPMNLGAILRSAYFLGVDRVASSLRHTCPLSPVVSKASSGVMEVLRVHGYENLEDMLKLKVAQGWQVVGTVAAGAGESQIPVVRCTDFQMTKPTLLLMGGEMEGLSRELLTLCQTLLTIPAGRDLSDGIESLNVSVATGILLHSLLSSRKSTT
ncbi:rRNA methyltransferase 1, mitochondrial [Scophthalmus maximus]|uniref:rRNA methyltransferase 1, mitochondrial n=2 Tax=Scophthalmus maximus TaxID=52904 RepID=A0A6A4S5J9_SCOMX|nr:rRNA methyltransferase 1, mitochondrial [Scophthalmus maximus]KAF0025814.1 hypothetical protein F2P81_022695 [Scophthalmus maximus]